jgi:hypothetical protein
MSMQIEAEFISNWHLTYNTQMSQKSEIQHSDSIYHVFEESNLNLEAVLTILRTKGVLDD